MQVPGYFSVMCFILSIFRNYHFTKESFSKATCIHSNAKQTPCSSIYETLKIIKNYHARYPASYLYLQDLFNTINNFYFMPIKYSRPTLHSCPLNIQHQLFILNICKNLLTQWIVCWVIGWSCVVRMVNRSGPSTNGRCWRHSSRNWWSWCHTSRNWWRRRHATRKWHWCTSARCLCSSMSGCGGVRIWYVSGTVRSSQFTTV